MVQIAGRLTLRAHPLNRQRRCVKNVRQRRDVNMLALRAQQWRHRLRVHLDRTFLIPPSLDLTFSKPLRARVAGTTEDRQVKKRILREGVELRMIMLEDYLKTSRLDLQRVPQVIYPISRKALLDYAECLLLIGAALILIEREYEILYRPQHIPRIRTPPDLCLQVGRPLTVEIRPDNLLRAVRHRAGSPQVQPLGQYLRVQPLSLRHSRALFSLSLLLLMADRIQHQTILLMPAVLCSSSPRFLAIVATDLTSNTSSIITVQNASMGPSISVFLVIGHLKAGDAIIGTAWGMLQGQSTKHS